MSHYTLIDSPPADTSQKWSVRMADSVLARHPVASARWHYEHGLMLLALERVWWANGDSCTWRYVREVIDFLIDDAGGIRNYAITDFNLDQINPGRSLFAFLREGGDARDWRVIDRLRVLLSGQPRDVRGRLLAQADLSTPNLARWRSTWPARSWPNTPPHTTKPNVFRRSSARDPARRGAPAATAAWVSS